MSYSSVSSAHEPETIIEKLSNEICEAVDSTVKGISNRDEAQARCFLGKSDLDQILDRRSLARLFKCLLTEIESALPQGYSNDGSESERSVITNIDDTVNHCIEQTIGDPSRTALLALLLYQDREELLFMFMHWLKPSDPILPSDNSMPLTSEVLCQYSVPRKYHRAIVRDQALFRPVTIRMSQSHEFQTIDRLPFVGAQTNPKSGSSGIVLTTAIARCHWEIESDGRFVVGNPERSMVVALKTFKDIPTVRNMEEATEEFQIERGILQKLRNSNIKHNMIMLDWGSISINDEAGKPISHSLIFELATFSLADFLKDERRARTYTTKSLLLARLIDIVEALACLHDNLKTMHLDIKPDNILVFEKGTSHSDNQNQDQHELIWKLSDFGLARKMGASQRSGHNRIDLSDQPSRSSATLATRPAGIFQAPEIQERNSSQAGRGSDVWSIGCVALMVLAFVCNGPTEVSKLTSRLPVDFMQGGGCQSLFYVRSDSHPWYNGDVQHYSYQYMENFNPDIGYIPTTQPQLQAAINPQVITWSNVLFDSYQRQPEQHLIQQWFEIVFRSVLLIDHRKRTKAKKLRDKLSHVQRQWRSYEADPSNATEFQSTSNFQSTNSPRVQRRGLAHQDDTHHPTLHPGIAPEERVQDSSPTRNDYVGELPDQTISRVPHRIISHESREVRPDKPLGSAIKDNDAVTVRIELDRDPGQLSHPCAGPNIYPIHWAISNKAYSALDVLLERSDKSITGIVCRGRTALQLACTSSGDTKALKCIRQHQKNFEITKQDYVECRKQLGSEPQKVLDNIYKTREPQAEKKSSFFRR
jgi:serine/threonine protein kinase